MTVHAPPVEPPLPFTFLHSTRHQREITVANTDCLSACPSPPPSALGIPYPPSRLLAQPTETDRETPLHPAASRSLQLLPQFLPASSSGGGHRHGGRGHCQLGKGRAGAQWYHPPPEALPPPSRPSPTTTNGTCAFPTPPYSPYSPYSPCTSHGRWSSEASTRPRAASISGSFLVWRTT